MSEADRQELINIKIITATIIKAQKKQVIRESKERSAMLRRLDDFENREKQSRIEHTKRIMKREKEQIRTHSVPLKTTEKSFQTQLPAVGNRVAEVVSQMVAKQEDAMKAQENRQERCHKSIEDKLISLQEEIVVATDRIEKVSSRSESQFAEVATRLDRELSINTTFRENAVSKHLLFGQCSSSTHGSENEVINPASPQVTEATIDSSEDSPFHHIYEDYVTRIQNNAIIQFTPSLIHPYEGIDLEDDHIPLFQDEDVTPSKRCGFGFSVRLKWRRSKKDKPEQNAKHFFRGLGKTRKGFKKLP